jgi:glycosyltransferase involved in cell wall biosynthesis
LPRTPAEFDLAFSMVEEVWAVSRFVQESLSARSPVPVVHMPLPVAVPRPASTYDKAYFGLPKDCFAFLLVFDSASYLERKNPIAVVRAFAKAFPDRRAPVRLILKTMNVRESDEGWKKLVSAAKRDKRISILQAKMAREELIGLMNACDAFVSLHRSEGFGLCIAESMWLGKAVISTNFSGTLDFAHEGTACVVDYAMCPVAPGAYPFAARQEWAEPDIDQASCYMRKLFDDDAFRRRIAKAGQTAVQENHNPLTVGRRYRERLAQIGIRVDGKGVQ